MTKIFKPAVRARPERWSCFPERKVILRPPRQVFDPREYREVLQLAHIYLADKADMPGAGSMGLACAQGVRTFSWNDHRSSQRRDQRKSAAVGRMLVFDWANWLTNNRYWRFSF
jgi:hypothetical protein